MPQCDKCKFFDREYDKEMQQYDDVMKMGDRIVRHHCPMYDDHIPEEIYFEGKDCAFFQDKS